MFTIEKIRFQHVSEVLQPDLWSKGTCISWIELPRFKTFVGLQDRGGPFPGSAQLTTSTQSGPSHVDRHRVEKPKTDIAAFEVGKELIAAHIPNGATGAIDGRI